MDGYAKLVAEFGSLVIVAFYVWHSQTKGIPRIVEEFREEQCDTRKTFTKEQADTREAFAKTLEKIELRTDARTEKIIETLDELKSRN